MKTKIRQRCLASLLAALLVVCMGMPITASASSYTPGLKAIPQTIAMVRGRCAYIDNNNTLWGWGNNAWNEFGLHPAVSGIKTPTRIMDDVASVKISTYNVAVLKTDGSLWICGLNNRGQIGNGATGNVEQFYKVMDNVIDFSISMDNIYASFMVAAVKSDGTLWTWGYNYNGQLGNGTYGGNVDGARESSYVSKPAKIMDNVVMVSCGVSHTAAIKTDGSLWMWGRNEDRALGTTASNGTNWEGAVQSIPVKVMEDTRYVSCGNGSTIVVKADNSVWECGGGKLFAKVMDDALLAKYTTENAYIVKTDGTLWSYGSHDYGQAGTGGEPTENISTPTKIAENIVYVDGGAWAGMALTYDGTILTWGYNGNGWLGYEGGNAQVTVYGTTKSAQTFPKTIPNLVAKLPTISKEPDSPKPSYVGNFTDVMVTDYYADAVKWAVDNNITSGTSATTFSPNDSCTRAQAVTFLWRAAGSPEPSMARAASFSDVPNDQYYSKAVKWAVEQGITSGVGGDRFAPNDVCTRGQIVTFLYRANGSPNISASSSFADVASGQYYADAVSWAVSRNITSGTGNNLFSPNDVCTRGQIVTFLYRNR